MAHESFEDEAIAAYANEHFVAVKVDREERPDVDAVYMEAVQAATGQGGWPMTVFLTPGKDPFYFGTYFPPEPRHGMPAFRQVLEGVSAAWRDRRDEVGEVAGRLRAELAERAEVYGKGAYHPPAEADLRQAVAGLARSFDEKRGGFGGAPKFPPSMAIEFLLRHHARTGSAVALEMAERTCDAMARGGIYDQLGGGFARYSVDADWIVPHFEKMLYDNALLLRVYLHLWRATGSDQARRITLETADFLLRELGTPEGGFASALDADSLDPATGKSVEGAYYAWTPEQLTAVLGAADAAVAVQLFDVTGTFEHGSSVLQLPVDPADPEDMAAYERIRAALLAARAERPAPARDDKVVAAWNGLAIAALAEAGALLGRPELVTAAVRAADLLLAVHLTEDGRLLRTSRDGRAGANAGVLEDYADTAEGFLALYAVTGDAEWLGLAGGLLDTVLLHFTDPESGALYDTADDAEQLIRRPQDPTDNATPSGWTAAAAALLTYAACTGSELHRTAAERALGVVGALAAQAPRFIGWGLAAAEALADGPREIAVVGPAGDPATADLHRIALLATAPGAVVALGEPGSTEVPLLADRPLLDGRPAAYVCRHFACDAPTADPAVLAERLGALRWS